MKHEWHFAQKYLLTSTAGQRCESTLLSSCFTNVICDFKSISNLKFQHNSKYPGFFGESKLICAQKTSNELIQSWRSGDAGTGSCSLPTCSTNLYNKFQIFHFQTQCFGILFHKTIWTGAGSVLSRFYLSLGEANGAVRRSELSWPGNRRQQVIPLISHCFVASDSWVASRFLCEKLKRPT